MANFLANLDAVRFLICNPEPPEYQKYFERGRSLPILAAACIGQFLVVYLGFMLARRGEALRTGQGIFQGE
jgi:hypothetical protein